MWLPDASTNDCGVLLLVPPSFDRQSLSSPSHLQARFARTRSHRTCPPTDLQSCPRHPRHQHQQNWTAPDGPGTFQQCEFDALSIGFRPHSRTCLDSVLEEEECPSRCTGETSKWKDMLVLREELAFAARIESGSYVHGREYNYYDYVSLLTKEMTAFRPSINDGRTQRLRDFRRTRMQKGPVPLCTAAEVK